MEKSKEDRTEALSQLGQTCQSASEKISKLQTQLGSKETVKDLTEIVFNLINAALKVNYEHNLQLRLPSDTSLHQEYIEDLLIKQG